ncbi:MAG: glucosylglycerol-phosphate synthase [Cyanobacteria bacterium P01_H01_bin.121]
MKSSLVILYHREPYDEVIDDKGVIRYQEKKSPNGILPTLKSFFAGVEQGTWVAWKQVTVEQKQGFQERVVMEGVGNYNVRRIPLMADEVKHFYHITSKEAFWPILHSFPYHFTSETSNWENFHNVNRKFAEAGCAEAADDALIWIHDYNLWLAPYYIRQLKPQARIAFFHHTPFPSTDIFNVLPWRQEITESLLCCDLVGFHIPRYAENFVNVARSLCDVDILATEPAPEHLVRVGIALAEPEVRTEVGYKGRRVRIDTCAVGANPEQINTVLAKPETQAHITQVRAELGDRKLILAAGRIDYVKGNKEKLEAFERLLERRPDLLGKIQFVVSCVVAASGMRVYQTAQSEIEQLVGRINGRFSTLNWTPAILFTQPLSLPHLCAYYHVADICWTAPLRDGLNLVAKEYVLAKEGKDGVLVLSEFVGAAVELPQSILTNPYSINSMDAAIEQAIDMPEAERKERMAAMCKIVKQYDVQYWADHLFEMFEQIKQTPATPAQEVAVV